MYAEGCHSGIWQPDTDSDSLSDSVILDLTQLDELVESFNLPLLSLTFYTSVQRWVAIADDVAVNG